MHKLQVLIIIDLRYFLLALKLIFSKIYRFSVINAKDLSNILDNEKRYSIVNVKETKPGNTNIFYEIQARL